MIKIVYSTIFFTFFASLLLADHIGHDEGKSECKSAISKVLPECNFIGTGVNKMKAFSKKNETIDSSSAIQKMKEKTKKFILEK